jgi:hypothetical protein
MGRRSKEVTGREKTGMHTIVEVTSVYPDEKRTFSYVTAQHSDLTNYYPLIYIPEIVGAPDSNQSGHHIYEHF